MILYRAISRHRGWMMRKMMTRAMLLAAWSLVPIAAQAQKLEGRVDRLSEMRAVQRKVFPGGSGQYVSPTTARRRRIRSFPVRHIEQRGGDLNARRCARVTPHRGDRPGRVRPPAAGAEEAFNAYNRTTDARLKALEDGASATASPVIGEPATRPTTRPGLTKPTGTPGKPATTTPAGRDPARGARVAAIEKPDTGDAGEDAYLYGYRLYQAKLYPEAEAQLKQVVSQYPRHKRASYAQNLLGRSYLDDGKPSLAALAFYESYKKFPDGERAPDSLMNLAESLRALNKPAADVCQVYDEVQKYGPKLTPKMKSDLAAGRAQSQCR